MNMYLNAFTLSCLAAVASAPAAAQQASPIEVTLTMPLNLTRLDSQIPKVRVSCKLSSAAIVESLNVPGSRPGEKTASAEFPVTQGDVVQTANVVMTFDPLELNSPSGKQAQYECELQGFISQQLGWRPFCNGCKPGTTGSHLVMTPHPAPITGAFVW